MTRPELWRQRYAMEMIERAADYLDAQVEIVQDLDKDGIFTVQIVMHLPRHRSGSMPLLPPAQDT